MCRNIKPLFNFDPPAVEADARAAALQYVRKVSGYTKPSKANEAVFNDAVERISAATSDLLDGLVTQAPVRSREQQIARDRERAQRRYAREPQPGRDPGVRR
jgi:hypothetical protein